MWCVVWCVVWCGTAVRCVWRWWWWWCCLLLAAVKVVFHGGDRSLVVLCSVFVSTVYSYHRSCRCCFWIFFFVMMNVFVFEDGPVPPRARVCVVPALAHFFCFFVSRTKYCCCPMILIVLFVLYWYPVVAFNIILGSTRSSCFGGQQLVYPCSILIHAVVCREAWVVYLLGLVGVRVERHIIARKSDPVAATCAFFFMFCHRATGQLYRPSLWR